MALKVGGALRHLMDRRSTLVQMFGLASLKKIVDQLELFLQVMPQKLLKLIRRRESDKTAEVVQVLETGEPFRRRTTCL